MTTLEVRSVSVAPSGLGKMEDRKRPASHDTDESAPPPKRQLTSNVNGSSRGHQDADVPGKDDLDKFQKEAIIRQMQEYKREKNDIEIRLNDLTKRTAFHDEHVREIDTWFSQCLDEIGIAIGKVDNTTPFTPFRTQLLSSSNEEFSKYLSKRSQDISTALERMFADGMEAASDVGELQEEVARLLALEKKHVNQLEKLQLEKDQMTERLETASMRYMMAEKKLDRAKSMTVAKLERQAIASGRPDSGHGGGGENGKTETNGQVDNESLAEAETARRAAVAASAKQSEHVEQISAENEKLTSQLTALKQKHLRYTDEDFAHTELCKQLKAQYEDVVKRANTLEFSNSELRAENSKFQVERSAFRTQLETESQTVINEKEAQLNKAEHDLARIRTSRDEFQAELQIRKASLEQNRTSIDQAKSLLSSSEERIKALESECERLGKSDYQSCDNVDESMPVEELRTKYANLERQYTLLNGELGSMSAAYTKLKGSSNAKLENVSELEEKIMRLSAEKAKADQKYFGTMKAKESKDNEIRVLRAQNGKSSDIISQLKDKIASSEAYIVKEDKHVAELKDAVSSLEAKVRDLQSQLDLSKVGSEGQKKKVEELQSALESKDSLYGVSQAAQRKAEVSLEELKADLEEKNKRLETWKSKGLGSENEHYEVLRSLAICTVCRKNFKDTAIKTCGHVFCKDCVEDRLSARLRKCPNCNKGFGSTDYLKITL